MVNRARGTESMLENLCPLRSEWSLRPLEVRICTDASEMGFAVREGCRELASVVGRVSEPTRCKSSSRSNRARSRALRSIAPHVVVECSSSEEAEVPLARRGVARTFWKCRCNFWKLVAYGGFFREENTIVLEARSILYAVRFAESSCPPGRLLILSDNLALVLVPCKGRSNMLSLLSVVRRIFASGFQATFRLIVQVDTVRIEIIPTEEVVSLTVIVTRANHHSFVTILTSTDMRPRLFFLLVKLNLHLTSMCPQ